MDNHFIPLKCINCGGKLEVYDDMTRLACSYCGSEMIANRKGGAVYLEKIGDDIKHVQINTNKTAAELALVRLKKDLIEAETQLKEIEESNSSAGCLSFVIAIGLGIWGLSVFGENTFFSLILLGIAAMFIGVCFNVSTDSDKQKKDIGHKIIELNDKITENTRIANQ